MGEHGLELVFGAADVLVGGVDDEVVVFGEDGDEGWLLDKGVPGQLVDKMEELGLVDGVPFGETGDVDDAVETDL